MKLYIYVYGLACLNNVIANELTIFFVLLVNLLDMPKFVSFITSLGLVLKKTHNTSF